VIPLKDDNPVDRAPVITVLLIAANVLAFLWQLGVFEWSQVQATGGDVVDFATRHLRASIEAGGVVPYEIVKLEDIGFRDLVPPPFTIFTSMFLHGDAVHLASNMLFLWVFGNNVEDALGRARFLGFYLACGVAAALLQVATSASMGPDYAQVPMVGASGAIAGALAAYMVLFPHARVLTLAFVVLIWLPAGFLLGAWFVMQVLSVVAGRNTGVALFAHIGGFVAGWILVKLVGRHPRWRARRVVW
jgi:membrane associated rhomboid family serine protease